MVESDIFMNFEEQIHRLKKKDIKIDDKSIALQILSAMPYKYLTKTHDTVKDCCSNISIEDLYFMHSEIDNFHSILLKYILLIEQSFKNKLSYLISEKYGISTKYGITGDFNNNDYLDRKNYSNSNGKRFNILDKLQNIIIKPPYTNTIDDYKHRNANIPPWILLENTPLGLAINWYSILSEGDKKIISTWMYYSKIINISNDEQKELFKKSLDIVSHYRNIFAHKNRKTNSCTIEFPMHILIKEYDTFFEIYSNIDLSNLIYSLCILSPSTQLLNNLIGDLYLHYGMLATETSDKPINKYLDKFYNVEIGKVINNIMVFPNYTIDREIRYEMKI